MAKNQKSYTPESRQQLSMKNGTQTLPVSMYIKEARRVVFGYIESRYNRKWIHSAIDYMTPRQ